MSEEPLKQSSFEILGPADPECQVAVDAAADALKTKLSPLQVELLQRFKIRFFKSEEEHGSHVDFENTEIVCNRDDVMMSLQQSEDYLVEQGVIEPGDTTSLLPDAKDRPWSTLTSELVHEYGHVIDKLSGGPAYSRLDPKFSPTKYGSKEPHETFAEAFRFYILDGELSPEARQAVENTINQNWGEL